MINIIVFNWNYKKHLENFIESSKCLIDKDNIRVIFSDDGSVDGSKQLLESFFIHNKVKNFLFFSSEIDNYGRSHPAFGQLEGLKRILDSGKIKLGEYVWLMDVDDTFNFNEIDSIFDSLSDNEVVYLSLIDRYIDKEVKYDMTRKVGDINGIWPTISPTSSIIIKYDRIMTWYSDIFDYSVEYDDIWLDCRINILSQNDALVSYSKAEVYRNIHGQNDSLGCSYRRTFNKQIQAMRYFTKYGQGSSECCFRVRLLRCIDVLYKKFK